MRTFLKIEMKVGEDLPGSIASGSGLAELLDKLYSRLNDDMAVEVHVYREFTLIGTRQKGHGDKMLKKFINFGFSPYRKNEKSDALSYAIRTIDDGDLPEYCYRAISGDLDALRRTTLHLIRAYDAKIRRMQDKGKSISEIEPFILRRDTAAHRLELEDDEFMEVSEPIIIEIPKNPEFFYNEDDVCISGNGD